MEFHEVSNIFPMMNDEEFAALKEDIQENGLIEPVWLYEKEIIDGRNRYNACIELDIEPKYREWVGKGSLISFVVSLNLKRRHLSSSQKAVIALEALPMIEAEAKERQKLSEGRGKKGSQKIEHLNSDKGKSTQQAAKLFDTNRQYVSAVKKIKETSPEKLDSIKRGERTIAQIQKELKEEKKEKKATRKAEIPKNMPENRFKLICDDFHIANNLDEKIDIIITDPPYPKEYLPLYKDLASVAINVLKPGGSLVVMIGQSYLPEILNMMCPIIKYQWMLSYLTPGGQSVQLFQRNVNTFWKPILWFVKGKYGGDWIGDVCKSNPNDNDKRFHEWGQSESGMADIIERFTYPGDTILDPFCGGGTTGIAAVAMNRKFIGIDSDEMAIETTKKRLNTIYIG